MKTETFDKIPPYGLVHDWLGTEMVACLLRFAQSNQHRFKDARVTHGEEAVVDRTRRVSRKLSLGKLKSEVIAEVVAKAKDLSPLMFERLGIKPIIPSFEVELVAHGDGAFFKRHIDTRTHQDSSVIVTHRIISAVYYFHVLPKAFSGGVLRLHSLAASGRRGTFIDIEPDFDTLIFFPSFFPHEVLPVIHV
jgi:SM-20-related protein